MASQKSNNLELVLYVGTRTQPPTLAIERAEPAADAPIASSSQAQSIPPQFGTIANELQILIWRQMIPGPRIITITQDMTAEVEGPSFPMSAVQSCKQAREVIIHLGGYNLLQHPRRNISVYIHPLRDNLKFENPEVLYSLATRCKNLHELGIKRIVLTCKVKRKGVAGIRDPTPRTIYYAVRAFKTLDEIVIDKIISARIPQHSGITATERDTVLQNLRRDVAGHFAHISSLWAERNIVPKYQMPALYTML